MELLREDAAARYLLVALIILAVDMLALGELYLLAVLLSGRQWMSRKLAKVLPGIFLLPYAGIVACFILASMAANQFSEAPEPSAPFYVQVIESGEFALGFFIPLRSGTR